jgi:hypothetical protein
MRRRQAPRRAAWKHVTHPAGRGRRAAGPVTVRGASSHYFAVIETPQSGRRRSAGLSSHRAHHHARPASGKCEAFAVAEPASSAARVVFTRVSAPSFRCEHAPGKQSVDRRREDCATKLPAEVKHGQLWGQRPPRSLLMRFGPRLHWNVRTKHHRSPLFDMTIVRQGTCSGVQGVPTGPAQPLLSLERRIYPLFLCNSLRNSTEAEW